MDNSLRLIGRTRNLFTNDFEIHAQEIKEVVARSKMVVIGGAGSIGRAVVKALFALSPRALHVVDLSENNLAELVRDIRSSLGYIPGDFRTYCLDCGSPEFEALLEYNEPYDFYLNFSALKHVRSEKDPFTLMRMIQVNILNTEKTLSWAIKQNAKKYFCVSTDKAANPVNMMGASKNIMEMYLMRATDKIAVSSARFANVAFSDGSLPDAFTYRLKKHQPLSAPRDVKRYFITAEESAVLCLLSIFVGHNRDLFFPKLAQELHLVSFSDIAVNFLQQQGYTPYICETEDEARAKMTELFKKKMWPCYFFDSDTTGEKDFEEFYDSSETVDWSRFEDIGVIENKTIYDQNKLDVFIKSIEDHLRTKHWSKNDLLDLFNFVLANFAHKEKHKYLDDRM